MKIATLSLTVLLTFLAFACKKDDGTAPNPNSPVRPTAEAASAPAPDMSAAPSAHP